MASDDAGEIYCILLTVIPKTRDVICHRLIRKTGPSLMAS